MTVARALMTSGLLTDPRLISGCVLWLDAEDSSTVTLVSSKVSQWNDKSGSGFNVTQGTAGARPTYAGTINGKSVVTFTIANSTVLSKTSCTLLDSTSGWSSFVAHRPAAIPATDQDSFNVITASGSNEMCAQRITATSGYAAVRARRLSTDTANLLTSTTAVGTSLASVQSAVGNYSTTTCKLYLNGVQIASTTSWLTSGNTDTSHSLLVGAASGALYFGGDICEGIIYNVALSDTNRVRVENYLRNKWGTG